MMLPTAKKEESGATQVQAESWLPQSYVLYIEMVILQFSIHCFFFLNMMIVTTTERSLAVLF